LWVTKTTSILGSAGQSSPGGTFRRITALSRSDITGSMSALLPPSWIKKVAWPIQVSASRLARLSALPSFWMTGTGTPAPGARGLFSS
jgi:hypothetical protein